MKKKEKKKEIPLFNILETIVQTVRLSRLALPWRRGIFCRIHRDSWRIGLNVSTRLKWSETRQRNDETNIGILHIPIGSIKFMFQINAAAQSSLE